MRRCTKYYCRRRGAAALRAGCCAPPARTRHARRYSRNCWSMRDSLRAITAKCSRNGCRAPSANSPRSDGHQPARDACARSGCCCVMQWMLPPPSRISRAARRRSGAAGTRGAARAAPRRRCAVEQRQNQRAIGKIEVDVAARQPLTGPQRADAAACARRRRLRAASCRAAPATAVCAPAAAGRAHRAPPSAARRRRSRRDAADRAGRRTRSGRPLRAARSRPGCRYDPEVSSSITPSPEPDDAARTPR